MAVPNVVQRKQLAKMGIAMPDGSYYIRNKAELIDAIHAVGRAQPDAGESDVARRNDVRQHCITRAKALHLESMIPDTWNSDGSLKQSATVSDEDSLEHFGVKGMHWGVRKAEDSGGTSSGSSAKSLAKSAALTEKAKGHEAIAVAHGQTALKLQADHEELLSKGIESSAFKKLYGEDGAKLSNAQFYAKYGESKGMALQHTSNDLRLLSNRYIRSTNHHSAQAAKLRSKAEAKHSDISPETVDTLEHFGVKGMHWGVRRSGSSSPSSSDHAEYSHIISKVRAAGGTHGLTNVELRTLNKRLELESNFHRLTSTGTSPHAEVQKLLTTAAKQEASKMAAKYAGKGAEWLAKEATKALLGTVVGKGKHA